MYKIILNRTRRTIKDAVFYMAPIWHLTNLRREAYDQVEDLHYQVGYCRANRAQVQDRLTELAGLLGRATEIRPDEKMTLEAEQRQLEVRERELGKMEEMAQEVADQYQEELPKLISELDLAIQMTRMNRSQKKVVKMLGNATTSDGSDVQEHIKKVRSQAYALSEQLSGRLATGRLKRRLALPAR